ncbi:MAG: YceD family protein [Candidatus Saccharimonadaceae bacterium]
MAKFSLYKIDLKNLPNGINTYSYELDRKFFEAIDHEEIRKGNVKAELTVKKTISAFEFMFHLIGTIQIPCDRCLDEMDQEIETDNRLIVKLGEEYSEESDEIVTVPADEGAINIAWYLYEFIVLNIPIKHVHIPGKCNKVMTSKYRKHKAVSSSDENDDDDDNDNSADFDEEGINENDVDITDNSSQETDPRWDVLKDMKDLI